MKKIFFFFLSFFSLFFLPSQATDKFANRPPKRFSSVYYQNAYFPSQDNLKVEMLSNGHSFDLEINEEKLNDPNMFPGLSQEYLTRHWRKVGRSKGWLGALSNLDLDQHYENHFSSAPGLMEELILQSGQQLGLHVNADQMKKWKEYEQARHDYLTHHFIQLRNQNIEIIDIETSNYKYYKEVFDHPLPSNFNEDYYFAFFYENDLTSLDADILSKAGDFGLKNVEDRLQHPFERRLLRSAYLERHCRGYTIPTGEYARIYDPRLYKIDFLSRLKDLNPSWPDFLAEAWVHYVGSADHLASTVDNPLKSSPLTFQKEVGPIKLYPYPVPKNESCLLFTLGLSPSSLNRLLEEEKRSSYDLIITNMYIQITKDLFPESLKTGELDLLIKCLHEAETQRQEKIDEINNLSKTNYTFDELVNCEDFKHFRSELDQLDYLCFCYEKGLMKWCERPRAIDRFLSHHLKDVLLKPDSKGNYLSSFFLSILAKNLNTNLIIYKKNPISTQLELLYKHEAGNSSSEVHHILFSGYYCQPLYTSPAPFNIPNMKAPNPLFIDDFEAEKSYTDNDVLIVCDLIKKIMADVQPDRQKTEQDIMGYTSWRNSAIRELNRGIILGLENNPSYRFHLNRINNTINLILRDRDKKLKTYTEEIENLFTSSYLIKKIEENPEYKEKTKFIDVDSVLEHLCIRNPIIIKPDHVLEYAPHNLDEIIHELEKKYNWIEVRDNGIYASENEDLYPMKILDFNNPGATY